MRRRRITLDVDEPLLARIDEAASAAAISRNQLIADAIKQQLREVERARIDRDFEAMADDQDYLRQLVQLENELSVHDRELADRLRDAEAESGTRYDAAR